MVMVHRTRLPGRSGGRAGAAGYDLQDVYVALQLAKMLTGGDDPIEEVFWEKKAIDHGPSHGVVPVFVDDAIIRRNSGKFIFTQVIWPDQKNGLNLKKGRTAGIH